MLSIESTRIRAGFTEKGAELTGLFSKAHNHDYLWNADPAYWNKTSPVLFPIIGELKGHSYEFDGKTYKMGRHGFARDKNFSVVDKEPDRLLFALEQDEETYRSYPFKFRFEIEYKVEEQRLTTTYRVINTGEQTMLFSVGAHPAFAVPLEKHLGYDDYSLEFEKMEQVPRWPITSEGLIKTEPEPFLNQTNVLPLRKELFSRDAVVLKGLSSSCVTLKSDRGERGLQFEFEGFPYLGLWAKPGADFLCIEPWCGIADSVNSTGQLLEKEGIYELPSGETFSRTWKVVLL